MSPVSLLDYARLPCWIYIFLFDSLSSALPILDYLCLCVLLISTVCTHLHSPLSVTVCAMDMNETSNCAVSARVKGYCSCKWHLHAGQCGKIPQTYNKGKMQVRSGEAWGMGFFFFFFTLAMNNNSQDANTLAS